MSSPLRHHRPASGGGGARRPGVVAGVVAALLLTAGLLLLAGGALGMKEPPPKAPAKGAAVFPPGSHPYGRSLAGWSAEWWEFTLAIPSFDPNAPGHPPNCRPSADGRAYMLVGIFSPVGQLDCVLPAGVALFLPVLNVECSSVEPPPFFGRTSREQRACASTIFDTATGLTATIDGRPVPDLASHRVVSPPFRIAPLPADNRLGVPAGSSGIGVSDGVHLMVRPLPPGEHTIRIGGSLPDFGFTLATTISVTVTPKR